MIGFACAINGTVNSAEVFASHSLFLKLWPKLLKATLIEGLAEVQAGGEVKHPRAEAFKACFSEVEQGKATEKEVTKRNKQVTIKAEHHVLIETRDLTFKDVWIHRSYIAR